MKNSCSSYSFFFETVSLCSPGWPRTCDPPASGALSNLQVPPPFYFISSLLKKKNGVASSFISFSLGT
jgi:hypothetical protein